MNAWWFLVIVYLIAYGGYLIWDFDQWNGSEGPLHWLWVTIRTTGYVLAILFTLGLILSIRSGLKDRK